MLKQLSYKPEKYDKFGIHKDIIHPTLSGLRNSNYKKFIDRILKECYLEEFPDPSKCYYWYLTRFMDKLEWYRSDIFTLYRQPIYCRKNCDILIVKNNQTKMVDNIIAGGIIDEIQNRINSNYPAYVAHHHSVGRSKSRIYELIDSNNLECEKWLVNQVNKRSSPCHLKSHFKTLALLNHNFEECDYRMDAEGRVYVIINHRVMTVHWNESDRFEKD